MVRDQLRQSFKKVTETRNAESSKVKRRSQAGGSIDAGGVVRELEPQSQRGRVGSLAMKARLGRQFTADVGQAKHRTKAQAINASTKTCSCPAGLQGGAYPLASGPDMPRGVRA